MAEELFVCMHPNGKDTWKCVASQLLKHGGNDPFGRPLNASQKARYGV